MRPKIMLQTMAIGGALLLSLVPIEARAQDADLEQRIFNLGILRTGKSSSKSGKKRGDPKAVLAQVQEDFTKLQVTNNELAEANEKPLDIDFVIKAISEIQTRADRLMENLTESKPSKNEAQSLPASKEQLKALITKLDVVVGEFAHNPVFKEASPDDEKLAKKALLDLDQIIQLASDISKGAEKLKNPSP